MPATALLLIDAQVNMFDPANPVAGADALLSRLGQLLARARAAGAPVVFVRNCGGEADPDERLQVAVGLVEGLHQRMRLLADAITR